MRVIGWDSDDNDLPIDLSLEFLTSADTSALVRRNQRKVLTVASHDTMQQFFVVVVGDGLSAAAHHRPGRPLQIKSHVDSIRFRNLRHEIVRQWLLVKQVCRIERVFQLWVIEFGLVTVQKGRDCHWECNLIVEYEGSGKILEWMLR